MSCHDGLGKLAIWIEYGDKAFRHEVEHIPLCVRQSLWRYTSRNDGMVVGHFRRVEHLLRLRQGLASEGLDELGVGGDAAELCLEQAIQRLRTLRIDVVR